MNTEKMYADEWKRCILNAGADENVAQQAIALAALNGLFDLHRSHKPFGDYPPGDNPNQERDGNVIYCERCEENFTPKDRDYQCPRCRP